MKSGRDLRVVPPVDATRVQIGEPENLPERYIALSYTLFSNIGTRKNQKIRTLYTEA